MESFLSLFQVFQSRKMAAIFWLGIASGLPFALTDDAFRAWMTKANFDLRTIGWFSLISLPYSFKVFWSPLLDRYRLPWLGRRRGWISLAQGLLVVAIAALALQMGLTNMGATNTPVTLQLLAFTALMVAFLSATQDIAIDAYRTDVLEERELGAGVALYVLGYRIAILMTGAAAFILADYVSWPVVYGYMALLMLSSLLALILAPEPQNGLRPPETLQQAFVWPFQEFFRRLHWRPALAVLLFIILYRMGDNLTAKMAVPFLGGRGLQFSDAEIGAIRQGMGLLATIVGTLTGGAVLSKIGINRSLWIFGALQAFSNLGYVGLAIVGKNYTAMLLAINVENFCSGLGTAGFVAFLMSLCNTNFSATQYALLSALLAVGRDQVAGPLSGELAQWLKQMFQSNPDWQQTIWLAGTNGTGWPLFFLITLLAALPGLFLLPIFAPWQSALPANHPTDLDSSKEA